MNSLLATNINGGVNNQQVANRSSSSVLLSSIEFSLTDVMKNSPQQGKNMIKLTGKEELLYNGQNKIKNCDQNKNLIENYMVVNGTKEKSTEDAMPVPKIQLYTGKIHVEWDKVYNIGAGLSNIGNTCFMNTVLQCLTYCPPLANYLLHDNDHTSKCAITGFCMMCLLQKHMKRAIGRTGEVIRPQEIYNRLKAIAKHFQHGRQEDAHEFLRYVIENLVKHCLPQTNGISKLDPASKDTTVINKIFGGYYRSQVICLRCKKQSNTYDPVLDFNLDIKQNVSSLEKALEKLTQPELLQHENSYKCPKCKMKVEAQKKLSVHQAPIAATFQLKRFDYNRSFGGKITKQITYPEKINLRPYMSDTQGDPVWYRLNAVLVHSGPTCNSGHYYCYVKNSDGYWYEMDDTNVRKVSSNMVLNQNAYVLFYIRNYNAERAPLKKCLDNTMGYKKGPSLNSPYSKVDEINKLKVATPSGKVEPFSTSKPCNSPNSVKKFNVSTANREKISFGFRTTASPTVLASPKNRTVSSESLSALNGGLVPYIEDSSDSSDESESSPSWNITSSLPDSNTKHFAKNGSPVNNKSSPHLETKSKLSMPVFSIPSPSIVSKSPPKVSATGSWIVTDVPPVSSSPSSNKNGVNSTTNWHVIEASDLNVNSSPTIVKDSVKKEIPDSPKKSIFETPASKVSDSTNEILTDNPSFSAKQTDMNQINSSAQKSNFRQQIGKSETYFPEENETNNSFKRKYSDSDSKISQDTSYIDRDKSRLSPSPKKLKHAKNSSFINSDDVTRTSNYFYKKPYDSSISSPVQQKQFSNTNCDNNSRTLTNGVLNSVDNTRIPLNINSNGTEGIKNDSLKSDRYLKGKQGGSPMKLFNSCLREKEKNSISHHDTNASLYGTTVPTWKEEKPHRPPSISGYEVRRSFDGYDNDFDQGKIRKSKPKDHYQFTHRKNLFQKYSDRYHGNNNYSHSGKFFKSHHDNRKYDSDRGWKHNHNNYQRNRNHYRRYRY